MHEKFSKNGKSRGIVAVLTTGILLTGCNNSLSDKAALPDRCEVTFTDDAATGRDETADIRELQLAMPAESTISKYGSVSQQRNADELYNTTPSLRNRSLGPKAKELVRSRSEQAAHTVNMGAVALSPECTR